MLNTKVCVASRCFGRPATYGELYDAYQRVWILLSDNLGQFDEDDRREAAEILLERSRGVSRYASLSDMVIETVSGLAKHDVVDKLSVLEIVMQKISFDGKSMPEAVLQKWERLRDSLIDSDYHSRMVRYVGADLYEDEFDDENNVIDKKKIEIKKIAKESLDSPSLLMQELDWLTTSKAVDGYRFGLRTCEA